MAILSNGKFYGFLCSVKETGQKLANGVKEYVEDFVSGFSGHGWKLWEFTVGKWKLEIDTIVVRGTMIIFELLISKIRAIIGAQAITQGHGKVKSARISDDGTEYLIVLEDEDMSIEAHDFVRCQTFTGNIKSYHVEVASVNVEAKTLHVPLSEFDRDELGNIFHAPAAGDELVQFGNSQNKARQSAIYMHADESGQPAIDVMFDIDSKNWEGKVKVRVGGEIPGTNGLRGFYSVNGLIKGVDNDGAVVYEFSPDGRVNIGRGGIRYNPTTNKVTLGSGVTLTWDNLDDETKNNLKGDKGDKGDQGLQGLQGEKGEQGIEGPVGNAGATTYFHIKYSSVANPTTSSEMTETPSEYIGTYVDYTSADSADPKKYTWARFQGLQGIRGDQGIPGINGEDGTTYYLHIKYSDDGGRTFTANNGETSGAWIGVCTDTNIDDPIHVDAYKWSKIKGDTGPQGVPGEPGKDGKVYYTWIRYADTAGGEGISNDPIGKKFIGLAYNKETATESNIPGDYTWSLFKGADGTDGVQGPAGENGKPTYTWIAYSDFPDGRDIYQIPGDNTKYIGIAVNKETATESDLPSDYTWSKFRGEDGKPGEDANLLPWIEEWNGYATELGKEYIVTPKMFSGTKSSDGKLTGIAQGKDCLTAADGTTRTGIFALVDNEIVFELDPISKKYNFNGTFFAKIDENNGWEVNEACENIIGNKKGKRIVISPNSQDIKIFDQNNNNVSVIEGSSKESMDDLFNEGSSPTITSINLPFKLPAYQDGAGGVITNTFYTNGMIVLDFSFQAIYVSTDRPINKVTLSIVSKNYADASLAQYINSTIVYTETISVGTRKDWHVKNEKVYIDKGYHQLEAYLYVDKISDHSFVIESADFILDTKSYMSTYFANGFSLGTSRRNMASFLNAKNGANKDVMHGTLTNERYGWELAEDNIKVKRDGHWGLMPSIVACGEVLKAGSQPKFNKVHSFDNSIPRLFIGNMGDLIMEIPQSWVNADVSYDTCYVTITTINDLGENWSLVTIGLLSYPYIYFSVQNSSTPTSNNCHFYFEIKRF